MCLFLSSTGHQREPGRFRAAEILLLLVSSCCESIWTLVLALRALCQQTQEETTRANCPLLREAVWSSVSKKNTRLARLGSAQLGSARPGPARPGLAHLPFCLNRLMEVQVRVENETRGDSWAIRLACLPVCMRGRERDVSVGGCG